MMDSTKITLEPFGGTSIECPRWHWHSSAGIDWRNWYLELQLGFYWGNAIGVVLCLGPIGLDAGWAYGVRERAGQ